MDIIKTNIAVFSLFQLFEKWNLLIATFKSTLTSALCHFYNYIFYFRIKKTLKNLILIALLNFYWANTLYLTI